MRTYSGAHRTVGEESGRSRHIQSRLTNAFCTCVTTFVGFPPASIRMNPQHPQEGLFKGLHTSIDGNIQCCIIAASSTSIDVV